MRASLASNFEDVLESCGCHKGHASSSTLKQCVCADGCAADKFEASCVRTVLFCENLFKGERYRAGGILRRRRELKDFEAAVTHENAVGKRAAGVDRDAHGSGDCSARSVESCKLRVKVES